MQSIHPVVLEHVTLPEFLHNIVAEHRGSSTVVVCSDKERFLENFATAQLASPHSPSHHDHTGTEDGEMGPILCTEEDSSVPYRPAWDSLSLRQIATTNNIRIIFCQDITHLRAFLAIYPAQERDMWKATKKVGIERGEHRILAIINPVSLHLHTSGFSAQGLNRTLALAVEAAHLTKMQLLIAECTMTANQTENSLIPHDLDVPAHRATPESPWDQEVSILNVTTKSFGTGERGWVGRTVKLRRVAERWCTFRTIAAPGRRS
nr:hypothetical protein CFP56_12240 [Quercus suber]